MSVTEFSHHPKSSDLNNFVTEADGFNAELQARLTDIDLFSDYVDQRAADASGHTVWITGTVYADGDVVYSPIDLLPYRANKDIASSTTDPSADGGTDWTPAGGVSAADQTKVDYISVTEAIDLDTIASNDSFTADGGITVGDVVVLKSATGKAASVTNAITSPAAGTPDVSRATTVDAFSVNASVSLGDGRLFQVYEAGSQLKCMISTFSGGSWSHGSEYTIIAADTFGGVVDYDSTNGRIIVGYELSSDNELYAVVCTAIGSVVTVNAAVAATSASNVNGINIAAWNGYCMVGYSNGTGAYTIRIGSTSDTTITFGTADAASSAFGVYSAPAMEYDADNDQVLVCCEKQSSNQGYMFVVTYSGTTATINTEYVFQSTRISTSSLARIEANKWVVGYTDYGDDLRAALRVVTVSGAALTFGSPLNVTNPTYMAFLSNKSLHWNSITNELLVFHTNEENSGYWGFSVVTISGTTLTLSTAFTVIVSTSIQIPAMTYDASAERLLGAYNDNSGGDDVIVIDFDAGSGATDADDWLGIAQATVADAATVQVKRHGSVDENQSGLTIGTTYYVDADGSLTTTANARKIGKAVAADKLYITEATV